MTNPKQMAGGQYLSFQLANDFLGCDILQITEILQYHRPTGVPLMPAFILGVINLRGRVVPVIDLAQRLGRPASRILRRSCIVILQAGSRERPQAIGLLVDAVHEVISLTPADILPPPLFGNQLRADFIGGLAQYRSHDLLLLRMEQVLSIGEMAMLSRPAAMQINTESSRPMS